MSRISLPHTALFFSLMHEVKAYLRGTGVYADREKHPLPHLILSDLRVGLDTAFDLLKWRNSHPELVDLPVLIFTGVVTPEILKEAAQYGADQMIEKTSDIPALVNTLDELGKRYGSAEGK